MQSSAQILVMTPGSDIIHTSKNGAFVEVHNPGDGYRVPAEFAKATSPAGHTDFNTAHVTFLKNEELLPDQYIDQIPVGPKEYYATQANLRFGGVSKLTAAIHLTWAPGGVSNYCFLLGGPPTSGKFTLRSFLGLESRDQGADEAEVTFTFDPSSVIFNDGKGVSQWKDIKSVFPDIHVAEGAFINLEEIMVRFRIRSNLSIAAVA